MHRPVCLFDRCLGHGVRRGIVSRERDITDPLARFDPRLALESPVFFPPRDLVGLGIV